MSELAGRDAVWTWESPGEPAGGAAAPPARLRLVAEGGRLLAQPSGQRAALQPSHVRGAALRPSPVPGAALRQPRRAPVRLTRRGRLVLTAAVVLAIGLASMALAGAAQATGHSGAPGTPGKGVTQVEIRAGQSLWSVAEAYDPNADTRLVIAEILQLNSLRSDQVQPGQVLWVPRG